MLGLLEKGHHRKYYPILKKGFERSNEGEIDLVTDQLEDADILAISTERSDREWIIDLGCTCHICLVRESFVNFRSVANGHAMLGDNSKCEIKGIG